MIEGSGFGAVGVRYTERISFCVHPRILEVEVILQRSSVVEAWKS